MNEIIEHSIIPGTILDWYDVNKRDLPWRKDREPYHIWVSEIMLQQTRVEAVKGYYSRFINALPTVNMLADADDAVLHKLWEGLGYYSRVRNMKKAANCIMDVYGGVFPQDYDLILSLPGIGPYTAGAICSIAFDLPTPAVDGNVLRLLSRIFNDESNIDDLSTKRRFTELLRGIYPHRAGDFTQALMELGATVCGPNSAPDCKNCPCKQVCLGYLNGTAHRLPVRNAKKQRRIEKKTVLILQCEDSFALCKRPDNGLLASMWQFPELDGWHDVDGLVLEMEKKGIQVTEIERQVERKHVFTHVEWHMRGFYTRVRNRLSDFVWMDVEQIRCEAALPTAFRMFLDEI